MTNSERTRSCQALCSACRLLGSFNPRSHWKVRGPTASPHVTDERTEHEEVRALAESVREPAVGLHAGSTACAPALHHVASQK